MIPENRARVGEGNHSLASEADAARGDAAEFFIGHAAVFPMAVWVEDGGIFCVSLVGFIERTVEITREEKTGVSLEINLLDGVTVAFHAIENFGVQRRSRRQRPKSATELNVFTDFRRALLPLRTAGDFWKAARRIQVARLIRGLERGDEEKSSAKFGDGVHG